MYVLPKKTSELTFSKDLLTLMDYSSDQIHYLLDLAIDLKKKYQSGEKTNLLRGKQLAMIFEKPSTRTRVSFEAGMKQLGGDALFLSSQDLQLGRGEPIEDTAKVLSEYVDAIMIRTFEHEKLEQFAKHATIPVINGLSEDFHPCQALADLLTIYEAKGRFSGMKLAYIGDGNNVAHSLMIAAAKVGMDISVASPEGYQPKPEITNAAKKISLQHGSKVVVTSDPKEAIHGADIIYTDVWTSMGHEQEEKNRLATFFPFQVNHQLATFAKSDYAFLHCLPAHRGEEVTEDIIDGPHSLIYQQAGNRLHVQKALLVALLG